MNASQFLIKLGAVTLLTAMFVLVLNFHPKMVTAQVLSWTTVAIFVALTSLIFMMGSYAAKQKNKNTFTSVVLLVMMTKMLLCILLVAIYVKACQPTNNFFFIPFFSIYTIYTIFEVYIMTRLGKDD